MRFGTRVAANLVVVLARPLIRSVHWSVVPGASAILAALVLNPSSWIVLVGLVLGSMMVWLAIVSLAVNRVKHLAADYTSAFGRGDADEMERLAPLIPRLEYPTNPRLAEVSAMARRAESLMVRGRWEEARDLLAGVTNVQDMAAAHRAGLLNNLAYVTARTNGAGAIELAEQALAAAKEAKMDETAVRATLGTALAKAGRHAEALPLLEGSAPANDGDRAKNDRMYWLGYTYRALGRKDDAREAFSAAAQLEGPCREDARAALADETPFRN